MPDIKYIEKDLSDRYEKNLEITFSLIKFLSIVIGLYIPILSYSKINPSELHFLSFLLPFFIAFCLLILQMIKKRKFTYKMEGNKIHSLENEDLNEHLCDMLLTVKSQDSSNRASIMLILGSIIFFSSVFYRSIFELISLLLIGTAVSLASLLFFQPEKSKKKAKFTLFNELSKKNL